MVLFLLSEPCFSVEDIDWKIRLNNQQNYLPTGLLIRRYGNLMEYVAKQIFTFISKINCVKRLIKGIKKITISKSDTSFTVQSHLTFIWIIFAFYLITDDKRKLFPFFAFGLMTKKVSVIIFSVFVSAFPT